MAEVVDIPLSLANQVPGVSGVDDVTLTIPQQEDIEDVVEDAVQAETEQAVEDAIPDEIRGAPQDGDLDTDAVAGAIAGALPGELAQVDVDLEGGVFGPTAGDLEDVLDSALPDDDDGVTVESLDILTLSTVASGVKTVPGITEADAREELRTRGVDPDRPSEEVGRDRFEITTLNPIEAIQQVAADIRRTFDDLFDGLEDIQEDLTEVVDTVGEGVDEVVEDALETVLPDLDGVSLLEDPVDYFTAGVLEGLDNAVDDEVQQGLQDAIAEAPEPPEEVR